MTSCDTFEGSFTTAWYGFDFGQDAFEGEVLAAFPPYVAVYQRLPKLPQ